MNSDTKQELIRLGMACVIVAAEWYMMQPYHEPLMAKFWLMLARFFQSVARKCGMLGLQFEHNYYLTVGA